jgi:DNA-binding transcriptional LysR family regulator
MLPYVLRDYHHQYPGIQLIIEESGSRDLVRELATGSLDLALILLPLQNNDPALFAQPLLHEDLVAVTAADAPPPVDTPRIRISDLRDRPLVMFRRGYDSRELVINACRAAGFEPTLAVEGAEMDAVLGFAEAGLGLAIVPSMVAERRPRIRITPFAPPGLTRTIALAHRKDAEPPRAARELRRVLLDYVNRAAHDGTLPAGTRPAGSGPALPTPDLPTPDLPAPDLPQ